MHITIIGAGIVGCLTAYYLRQDGHEITLIDRNRIPGSEASAANAGQLSYSFLSPLGSPSLWSELPKIALGLHPRIAIDKYIDPDLWKFSYQLLRHECGKEKSQKNLHKLYQYAAHSRRLMADFISDTGLSFDHETKGRIDVYDDATYLDAKEAHYQKLQEQHDFTFERLSANDCHKKLSFLAQRKGPAIIGGIYMPDNAVGDCAAFCQDLVEKILKPDPKVTCLFATDVSQIVTDGNYIKEISTSQGTIKTDHYIVCAGAWAGQLLKPIGISVPIYPIRGYNITLPKPAALEHMPSFLDVGHQMIFTPYKTRLRAAMGFEMAGFNKKMPARSHHMIELTLNKIFPKLNMADAEIKIGFRPFTPNSLPIIGHSQQYTNLTCNIGQGMFGWTIAQSCAHQTAALFKDR